MCFGYLCQYEGSSNSSYCVLGSQSLPTSKTWPLLLPSPHRIKNLLSWQNILSNRQIAADIEEKWPNQEVIHRGIRPIYLSSSNKWKPCHGAINSRPCNLRMALEKYFRFRWNCKQLRIEARHSMANSEIYFRIFSETIHIILKIFLQHDLRKVS